MLSPFKCITRSSSLSMEETKLFAITIVYFLLLFAVIRILLLSLSLSLLLLLLLLLLLFLN